MAYDYTDQEQSHFVRDESLMILGQGRTKVGEKILERPMSGEKICSAKGLRKKYWAANSWRKKSEIKISARHPQDD